MRQQKHSNVPLRNTQQLLGHCYWPTVVVKLWVEARN